MPVSGRRRNWMPEALEGTHLGQVETGCLGAIVVVTAGVRCGTSGSAMIRDVHEKRPRPRLPLESGRTTHRSMCRTFLPSTDRSPERTHSVRPVPRMICGRCEQGQRARRGEEGAAREEGAQSRSAHPLLQESELVSLIGMDSRQRHALVSARCGRVEGGREGCGRGGGASLCGAQARGRRWAVSAGLDEQHTVRLGLAQPVQLQ